MPPTWPARPGRPPNVRSRPSAKRWPTCAAWPYKLAADGYPETTDIDYRLLVGYGANADRYEDWRTKRTPQRDSQQPLGNQPPLKWYPANALERDDAVGEYLVTGQVPGESAVHTATDIPLSAYGPGALAFTGVIDNTDVFFKAMQAVIGGWNQ